MDKFSYFINSFIEIYMGFIIILLVVNFEKISVM